MADQKVNLKIGADTSEIEKAFGALIKKIQGDADKLKLSPMASKTAPGAQITNDRESTRNKTFLDAQAKQYAAIVKSLKEEYGILQQIGRERERQNRQEHIAQIQKTTFTQIQRNQGWAVRGGVSISPPNGPPPPLPPAGSAGDIGKGGITNLAGLAGALGIPGMAVGMAASAVAAVKATEIVRRFVSEAPIRARETEASAFQTKGQAGQRLQSFFNGGAPEELMFDPQRIQAAQIAKDAIESRYSLSSVIKYNPMAQTLRGIYGDRALGALQHGQFMQAARAFGGRIGIPGMQEEFEANKMQEQADLQATQTEALKKGPGGAVRTAVADKFLKDWRRNLDFQRQTGLSEGGFREFLGGINKSGFQDELGMGMASSIMGAGGSTRAATGNAGFALQMGRQFDLTNAGQAMGSISGQLGGSQQSKDALIAIQAEGTRIGLNRSDMREENRKFVEMAANVINQSNATSAGGVDQVLDTLTKFMSGANTMSGLQAGQSAYEMYQRQSNIQSGPSAVMRSAGMRKDEVLGQLTERQRAILSTMPETEITPDSLVIQNMAGGDPKKVQQIVDNYHKVIGESLFVNPTTDEAITKLRKAKQAVTGPMANANAYGAQLRAVEMARGNAAGEESLEQMFSGATEKQRLAGADALSTGNYRDLSKIREEIKNQVESGKTTRPGDEAEKQQAQAARMANELFTAIKDTIIPAAKETEIFTGKISALVAAMKGGSTEAIQAAMKNLGGQAPGTLNPSDQTHANTGGPPTQSLATHGGGLWQ